MFRETLLCPGRIQEGERVKEHCTHQARGEGVEVRGEGEGYGGGGGEGWRYMCLYCLTGVFHQTAAESLPSGLHSRGAGSLPSCKR